MKKSIFYKGVIVFLSVMCFGCNTLKEAAEAEKLAAEKKNYTGWVDASTKDITIKKGSVQMKVKPNLGTYTLSVLNEKNRAIPVISSAEEFTTSTIYLKTSKKLYKLVADNIVQIDVKEVDNGVKVEYDVAKTAKVVYNFDFFQSSIEKDLDGIKVTAEITNTSNKKDSFAIKQIIDTVLGEDTAYHFYDGDNKPVKNEVMFRNPVDQKWFLSRNNKAAIQFFFNGKDATVPEIIALANYTTLNKNGWEPDMLTFRTFDTVLSYSNSGIGVIWPEVSLLPGESTKIVYYLVIAADGNQPEGEVYIYGKDSEPVEIVYPSADEKSENENGVKGYTPKENVNVEFNIPEESKEKYSQEYIQNLINRIAELEQDSASINRAEILQLNAELDEILSALRQQ